MTTRKSIKPMSRAEIDALLGPLTFGSYLACIRQCDGFTRISFAKKLGITPQFLCDLEKGRRIVSLARAYRWGELLGYGGDQAVWLAAETRLQLDLAKAGHSDIEMHVRAGAG